MPAIMQQRRREKVAAHYFAVVARSGWTEETALRFERDHGDDIRRLIVLYLWKLGLVAYRFDPSRAERLLQNHCLEVFENTLSDVWLALTRGLIADYLRELGTRSPEVFPFRQYLAGVVRNVVIENARRQGLLPRESEGALLRGFCATRRKATHRAHLARAMYQLQTKAEREILQACPERDFECVYANLYRLVHHFFERYVPGQCQQIEKLRGPAMIARLAEAYMDGEYRDGLEYTGAVTPWDPNAVRQVVDRGGGDDADVDEDEFLALLALREGQLN
jgi:hypothetical protein